MEPPRPQAELVEDTIAQILLGLPPDDPACLVRAGLVCKPWLRILSDPGFPRRYRVFHRAPPLLGSISNIYVSSTIASFVASFTAFPSPRPEFAHLNCLALDCRHGRTLLSYATLFLIVWDPLTGDEQYLSRPAHPYASSGFTAAVLCAADGCDHLDCHGAPFLLVFVSTDDDTEALIWASVYSSETGEWIARTSLQYDASIEMMPSVLTGGALYFTLDKGLNILKYNMVERGMSVFQTPGVYKETKRIVMMADNGGLGFAGVDEYNLDLWSLQAGTDGVERWERHRVIDLKTLLPVHAPMISPNLSGFAEGTNIIFVSTDVDAFMIELKSGKVRKLGEKRAKIARETGAYYSILPYKSFYIPDLAKGRLPPP